MNSDQERILVVESDPAVSDLIGNQTLKPLGYSVKTVDTVSEAIKQAVLFAPHLVLSNLRLPDLSGKDLLVALTSQGVRMPVILIANEGLESDVIQAFRLGATDYLRAPIREAELVSVVERALKQTRARREREQLSQQLKKTNDELQRRLRELTTIFAIGKAVTSITDQASLFDRILEGAVEITQARRGWVLVRNEKDKVYYLRAYQNLPATSGARLNQPWDDGISSLVALSGESLSIHGDPLKRFAISRLGQAALVVPVRAKNETIGLLVVMREEPMPFTSGDTTRLEAIADYASISLTNASLFRALEGRARSLQKAMEAAQQSERSKDEMLRQLQEDIQNPLLAVVEEVESLIKGEYGVLPQEPVQALRRTTAHLDELVSLVNAMEGVSEANGLENISPILLNDLVRHTISRYQHITSQTGLAVIAELPTDPVIAMADSGQIKQVFDGLITNAIKFSPQGGQITIRVEKTEDNRAHVMVKDTGSGFEGEVSNQPMNGEADGNGSASRKDGGMGLRLAFVRDLIAAQGGEAWVENMAGNSSAFHFTLTLPDPN
ncbi:MAG TPA: ATP-binding protein [Anaerolineales bacterium]|nr:ATP-binding protein [Anaerolineales bacterium]